MGKVEIRVTDAPPADNITSVMVTVSKVEIHRVLAEQEQQKVQSGDNQTGQKVQAGDNQTLPGEWLTINIPAGANAFDLIKIKGIEQTLGADMVPVGKYTQVRLIVDKIEVALGDGKLKPATVPSGELKLVHPFDISASQPTTIVLDFDADKSVNVTGKDNIMVKPVIKLTVR